MSKLVAGVGVNDGTYPARQNKKLVKQYTVWESMLRRTVKSKTHGINLSYFDCSLSENFKSYTYFYEWCSKQVGFNLFGYELDKDLLLKGNKVYSEDTCVFIPQEVNVALTRAKNQRGDLPVGVCFDKGKNKYRASICLGEGKRKHLGYFVEPKEAFLAYKQAKEAYLVTLAEKYKRNLDHRAYQALKTYQVEITD